MALIESQSRIYNHGDVNMQTERKDKDKNKIDLSDIDWSALEEHWANDYNDVYAPKE